MNRLIPLLFLLPSCGLLGDARETIANSPLGDAFLLRGEFDGRATVGWTPKAVVILSEAQGRGGVYIRNELGDFVLVGDGIELEASCRIKEYDGGVNETYPIEDDGTILIPEARRATVESALRPDQIQAWGIVFVPSA